MERIEKDLTLRNAGINKFHEEEYAKIIAEAEMKSMSEDEAGRLNETLKCCCLFMPVLRSVIDGNVRIRLPKIILLPDGERYQTHLWLDGVSGAKEKIKVWTDKMQRRNIMKYNSVEYEDDIPESLQHVPVLYLKMIDSIEKIVETSLGRLRELNNLTLQSKCKSIVISYK